MKLEEYQDKYSCAHVSRDDDAILTIRLHSRGQSLLWSGRPHRELPRLFSDVSSDRDNRVVVLTGTGERFIGVDDPELLTGALVNGEVGPLAWDNAIHEGVRLLTSLLDIDVPVVAAVNGPAQAHSELAVLSDIVLACDTAWFQDIPHAPSGLVPGDGMQIIWPILIGPNRARYFLLTGERIDAEAARGLGVVNEVLPQEKLLERAYELAGILARRNPVMMRNTRHVLVRQLKKAILDDLHYGLALECIGGLAGREYHPTEVTG
jgi:enoyl-CoA hydratase/carnithine racemase